MTSRLMSWMKVDDDTKNDEVEDEGDLLLLQEKLAASMVGGWDVVGGFVWSGGVAVDCLQVG